MNNKISGTVLHTGIQFGQFKFLKMLYRVIQTELLQEAVSAHSVGPLAIKRSDKTWLLESSISSLCNGEFYLSPRLLHGFVQNGIMRTEIFVELQTKGRRDATKTENLQAPSFSEKHVAIFSNYMLKKPV